MEKMYRKGTITQTLFILAVSVHLSGCSTGSHSLKYLHTGVKHEKNLQYTAVGLLDGEEFVYYDSNIRKMIPKAEWTKKIDAEEPDYWNRETEKLKSHDEWFRENIATLMKRFNQTDGNHTWQWTYGCDLHDDGPIRGYNYYVYDGKKFLTLDLNTLTWTAANSVAHITKQKMGADRSLAESQKDYLENTCIDYLKKYIAFCNTSLKSKGSGTAQRSKRNADKRSSSTQSATATLSATHSLQYIITAVTPGINSPEYIEVGLLDGEPFVYYDSKIKKMIPKTEWIKNNEDEDCWDAETQTNQATQEIFKANIATAMSRFNQTEGVHTVQAMYGCELHDDGTTTGYRQEGYDGEDFISLDLNTLTWTAANDKAVITKNKWEATGTNAHQWKGYLENTCIEWLQKYVSYSRDTLERKDPPEVTLFQKDSSSPVVCHATGFFPKGVAIFWQKNGEDLRENVELTETLPNQDGTYQKRSILTVSPEDLNKNKYSCVVHHSGLEKDLVLAFQPGVSIGVNVGAILAVLLLVLVGCAAFLIWRKKKKNDFKPFAASDGESLFISSYEGQPPKC
ncbi:patr class I histocompatibility antigen, A-2 alpha chain-like isoform X2 [Electrophorus electricus]|uniref:patr class I histocompatibility antigen, A-2 alpha chain-like isoform X2 n=1 Tax=Electrophorus electricus TaxID=8005 RepID=UPI0015CFBE01|nr:patr class I histocompatibility antigen, A-2 alpha chain-like isoform X2 [Electrophorus electricus]